ncbi:hypothetical protein Y1Q_0001803 [Alligator mississippiensis]|uniref:Uncharacterized protein n=1 Tax=Alligator mississippiensis TaxID=8496 RepID=A0A151MKX8_ALLMI|nr:hypothetical protein Y1Q_0001803 [Alligator mississippiensis]
MVHVHRRYSTTGMRAYIWMWRRGRRTERGCRLKDAATDYYGGSCGPLKVQAVLPVLPKETPFSAHNF